MEPSWKEPDVSLLLRHALLVGLAHDDPGRLGEELTDDDPGAALLQVTQVLKEKEKKLEHS